MTITIFTIFTALHTPVAAAEVLHSRVYISQNDTMRDTTPTIRYDDASVYDSI